MTLHKLDESIIREVFSHALEGMIQEKPEYWKEYHHWNSIIDFYFSGFGLYVKDVKDNVEYNVDNILTVEENNSINDSIKHYESMIKGLEKTKDKSLYEDQVLHLGYFRYKKKHQKSPIQTNMTLIEKLALSNCLTFWMERDGKKLYWINKTFRKDNIRSALGLSDNEQIPWKQIEAYQQIFPMPKIKDNKVEYPDNAYNAGQLKWESDNRS